jgi:hypothetical protein
VSKLIGGDVVQQMNIHIGEVDVPIILDGGEEWFPISYISNKILLRKDNNLITKHNKAKYIGYLNKYLQYKQGELFIICVSSVS